MNFYPAGTDDFIKVRDIVRSTIQEVYPKYYPTAVLSSSLPAYSLYIKLGYVPVEYKKLKTNLGQVLCYHEMEKAL